MFCCSFILRQKHFCTAPFENAKAVTVPPPTQVCPSVTIVVESETTLICPAFPAAAAGREETVMAPTLSAAPGVPSPKQTDSTTPLGQNAGFVFASDPN